MSDDDYDSDSIKETREQRFQRRMSMERKAIGNGTELLKPIEQAAWYKHCKQGEGYVVHFPVQPSCHDGKTRGVKVVGTCNCFTCVGLYIRLDDDTCFTAHIAAEIPGYKDINAHHPSVEQGHLLKEAVVARLASVKEVQNSLATGRKLEKGDIVICSEQPEEIAGETTVGKYIIEGLQSYLQTDASKHAHGFIARQELRKIMYLRGKPKDGEELEYLRAGPDFIDWDEEYGTHYGWHSQGGESDLANVEFSQEWHFRWDAEKEEWSTGWVAQT